MDNFRERPPNRALLVLLVSGAFGFAVGMFKFPMWQVAIETAQVVAHIVKYPAGNPFYIYHTTLWTILHQIGALLLLSGVSEIAASKLFSGVLVMVSFQALAMVVYALSEDALLAIGAALIIFFSRIAEHGVVYPISLTGFGNTYGELGLSLIILVAALLGTGCYGLGGFLLGLAPAVHPALGAWLASASRWPGISEICRAGGVPWAILCRRVRVTLASLLTQLFVCLRHPACGYRDLGKICPGLHRLRDAHRGQRIRRASACFSAMCARPLRRGSRRSLKAFRRGALPSAHACGDGRACAFIPATAIPPDDSRSRCWFSFPRGPEFQRGGIRRAVRAAESASPSPGASC